MSTVNPDLLRDGAAYADQWLAYQQAHRDIPGVVAAIQHDHELLLASGYGYAQLEQQIPMRPTHLFRIASHSKTFTATAILQLTERGALRLDDRLAAFIPWLQDCGSLATVTIRQALNHTAGIVRDGYDQDYWALAYPFPDEAGLRDRVEQGGAVLPANDRFKYSNIAYSLLGLVIEHVSGMSYHRYVQAQLVDRLGLRDTGPEIDDRARTGLATGYTAHRLGLPRRPVPDVPTGAMAAATGFYSTATDLCRYASAHYFGDETLISDASKREMQQPYWEVGPNDGSYGLGLVAITVDDRRLVGHGGGFPGYSTRTLIDTRDRLVVVVLTNETGGPAALLANTVVRVLNTALRQPAATTEACARLDRYTGRFASAWGVTDVVRLGSALFGLNPELDDPLRAPSRLEVVDEATLRIAETGGYGSPGELLRYERDDDGRITRVRNGGASTYPLDIYRRRFLDGSCY